MLLIALLSTISTTRRLTRETSAPGQVVDMTARLSYDSETKITNKYYYSEKPLNARIRSVSSTILQWILPGITGIVGIVFVAVTLLVSRAFKWNSEP